MNTRPILATATAAAIALGSLIAAPAAATAAQPTEAAAIAHAKARTSAKAPTITGTAQVGRKLAVKLTSQYKKIKRTGSLKFQWYANGKKLSGKRSSSLTLTPSHYGKTITVKVTAKKSSKYRAVTRTSKRTAAVQLGAAPRIRTEDPAVRPTSGTMQNLAAGSTLKAPTFGVSGMTYTYQWAGVTDTAQAKKQTYTLQVGDMGSIVSVTVTGTLRGYKPRIWKSERILLPSAAYSGCRAAALTKNGLDSNPNPTNADLISEYIVDLVNCERQEVGVPAYTLAPEMKAGSSWWANYMKSVDGAGHPDRLCAPNCWGDPLERYWNGSLGNGAPNFGFAEAPGSYVDRYENGVWVGADFISDGPWVVKQYDFYAFSQASGLNTAENRVDAATRGVTSWMSSPAHCEILLDYTRTRAYSGVSFNTYPSGAVEIFRTLDTYVSPHIPLSGGKYSVSDDQYTFASQAVRDRIHLKCEGN